MSSQKIILLLTFIILVAKFQCNKASLRFLDESTLRNLIIGNECFQPKVFENGLNYQADVSTNGQYWSAFVIKVGFKNTCSEGALVYNLNVGFSGLQIDGKDYKDAKPWLSQQGPVWLSQTSVAFNNDENSYSIKLNSDGDWAKLSKGAEVIIGFNFGYNTFVNKIEIKKVDIGQISTTGSLQLNLKNLPIKQLNKFSVLIYKPKDSNPTKTVEFESVKEDHSVEVKNLQAGQVYEVRIKGLLNPSSGVGIEPYIKTSSSIIKDTIVAMNIVLEPVKTREVTFKFVDYPLKLPFSISFTDKSNSFEIISKLDNLLNKDLITNLPVNINIDYIINLPSDSNISFVSDNEIIKPDVSVVTIKFKKDENPQPVPPVDNGNKQIGAYFQSWSAGWASKGENHDIVTKIPKYIDNVLIAFATPQCTYSNKSWSGTGLQFSSDFSVVADAIKISKQSNPNRKFLLSVGGATYPFNGITKTNIQALVNLVNDLGIDGLDIDFEDAPNCTNVNTDNITCQTDEALSNIIRDFRSAIGTNKLVTAATFSVGAYGNKKFDNNTPEYGPSSAYAGMWINPLKKYGNLMNGIFIMSYDASPAYNPNNAFDAYKYIFPKGSIWIGLEVPPEAWGGYVLSVNDAKKFANYALNKGGNGVFIWSLQKSSGSVTSGTFLVPICKETYGRSDC